MSQNLAMEVHIGALVGVVLVGLAGLVLLFKQSKRAGRVTGKTPFLSFRAETEKNGAIVEGCTAGGNIRASSKTGTPRVSNSDAGGHITSTEG